MTADTYLCTAHDDYHCAEHDPPVLCAGQLHCDETSDECIDCLWETDLERRMAARREDAR